MLSLGMVLALVFIAVIVLDHLLPVHSVRPVAHGARSRACGSRSSRSSGCGSGRSIRAAIVIPLITAHKAGIALDVNELEAHYLAGGNVKRVVNALISADKAGIALAYKQATAIDLAGRDVFEAVQVSVNPKVITTPKVAAMAKDGIQLLALARVTVRANINRLVGGAGEETILARVGEGIVTTIGSAESHKEVLENPDLISKTVLAKGLDAGTAFEILSIDIADVDVGKNIGAELQTDQAEADKRIAQAKAEERRALAVAMEQEYKAEAQKQRAKRDRGRGADPAGDGRGVPQRQPRRDGLSALPEHPGRHRDAAGHRGAERLRRRRRGPDRGFRRSAGAGYRLAAVQSAAGGREANGDPDRASGPQAPQPRPHPQTAPRNDRTARCDPARGKPAGAVAAGAGAESGSGRARGGTVAGQDPAAADCPRRRRRGARSRWRRPEQVVSLERSVKRPARVEVRSGLGRRGAGAPADRGRRGAERAAHQGRPSAIRQPDPRRSRPTTPQCGGIRPRSSATRSCGGRSSARRCPSEIREASRVSQRAVCGHPSLRLERRRTSFVELHRPHDRRPRRRRPLESRVSVRVPSRSL